MNDHFTNVAVAVIIILSLFSCNESNRNSETIFTEDSFNEYIKRFKPNKRDGVSEKEFELGKVMYERALERIKKDSFKIDAHNYWSLSLAQINLGEQADKIRYTFFKAYELDPETICFILHVQETDALEGFRRIIKVVPEAQMIVDTCKTRADSIKDSASLNSYIQKNDLNHDLVMLFRRIDATDQKYRISLDSLRKYKIEQDNLDVRNQKIIDSLFSIYKEYIGVEYVGYKYKDIMWLVIQHSNLEKMKKYLPVIEQAVNKGELSEDVIKLLIDRIYHIEYGYQIFGSQSGVEIAPDTIRREIIKKYSH